MGVGSQRGTSESWNSHQLSHTFDSSLKNSRPKMTMTSLMVREDHDTVTLLVSSQKFNSKKKFERLSQFKGYLKG